MSGRDYLVPRGRHPPGLLALGLTDGIVQAASIEGYAKPPMGAGQPRRASQIISIGIGPCPGRPPSYEFRWWREGYRQAARRWSEPGAWG
jgi:hypothetical protein